MKKTKKTLPAPKPSKDDRLFENLLRITQQFMNGRGYSGLTEKELLDRLSLPPQHEEIFKKILVALVADKTVQLNNDRYMVRQPDIEVISGVLRVHPRGFGFLQPRDNTVYTQDIFIPKHLTQNAVDGDIVEVLVSDVVSEKGPEGKVTAILKRGRTHMGGIIKAVDDYGDILAYVPLLGAQQRVVVMPNEDFQLKVGDRVVMEVKEWGSKESGTVCKVSHYIGHISDPSCDIKAAIEEFAIKADFPNKVVQEAQGFGTQVSVKEIKNREDLRDLVCFTIDPDTAKDFDDAISLHQDEKGNYHLGVHIADVSHYVRPGSALDLEASERCNSTYFPGTCIPMLPGELSNNLCSLKPNVNRLTVTIFIDFDADGNLLSHRITRSVIKSAKRFTYKEAKLVLDGKKASIHEPKLQLMKHLCGLLKKKRYERGSIEFSMPELVVLVDDQGVPYGTDYIEYDITHQLVEEFMLKANEMVATHLTKLGKGLTYRIHDEPAEENMKDFSVLAGAFGFKMSEVPTQRELQLLFDEAAKTSYGEYLATSFIRRMRLAMYSADNIGHYGLGLTYYCHFTSPIRRYVDLVVHRLLFEPALPQEELEFISEKCSEQERISSKAENNVRLLKKLRLLNSVHEKEPGKQYDAVVTKIKNFGVHFEILDYMLESFLHVSELENDYYIYDDAKSLLRGRRSGQSFCSGDKITVMLKEINFITQESKWSLVAVTKKPVQTIEITEQRSPKKKKNFLAPKHSQPKKSSPEKRKETPKKDTRSKRAAKPVLKRSTLPPKPSGKPKKS